MDGSFADQSSQDSSIVEVCFDDDIFLSNNPPSSCKGIYYFFSIASQMNNSKSVLVKIANLYAEQLMSDICLVVGENRYPAHRVILCASSEVFQVSNIHYKQNKFNNFR